MEKMKMQTLDPISENVKKIGELFPNVITEAVGEDGKLRKAINFEKLAQELTLDVIDKREERYDFTWVGKNEAIIEANTPTTDTLRPYIEESRDFENTQNLYIEGDNLDVLKILQESYLNKVKMIYIDPPYNTGKDFIYKDNFRQSQEEFNEDSDLYDEDENRQFIQNNDTNPRFHSDWCSMIYARLKLAKNMLREDGVIFISIDDNEVKSLKNICDEIFGEHNFLGIITWNKKRKGSFLSKKIISLTEYVLVYSKNSLMNNGLFGGVADDNESQPLIKRTNTISELNIPANTIKTKLLNGIYKKGIYGDNINAVELLNDIEIVDGIIKSKFSIKAPFIWTQEMFDNQLLKGARFTINTLNFQLRVFKIQEVGSFKGFPSYINGIDIKGTNEDAYEELEKLFNFKKIFDYSKPTNYIIEFIKAACNFDKNAVILDFFSGSATTAHAVMQLNAEDGGNRKHIMVQLPEVCGEKTEAYKAGYKNICEIGKERIRRAGDKIKAEIEEHNANLKIGDEPKKVPDIGFRVLKVDSTNMRDVYYSANEYTQDMLDDLVVNIKDDRSAMDLLYGVLIDWGLLLCMKCKILNINGLEVHNYDNGSLVACLSNKIITEDVMKEIANLNPMRAVFNNQAFATSKDLINLGEIFEYSSPNTQIRLI